MTVRIFLVEDHALVRDGLRRLLNDLPGHVVAGEAGDGATALRALPRVDPDAVLVDVILPDMSGIELVTRLRAMGAWPVVGLSMVAEPESITAMLQAGAAGYVLKDSAFEELEAALRAAVAGELFLCPRTADILADASVRRRRLTPRERQVLSLLADGQGTRLVAAKLGISVKTVEAHRKNVQDKLGVRSIAGLTKHAIRSGLTRLD